MKFRKKPVDVEAFSFYVDSFPEWFMQKVKDQTVIIKSTEDKNPTPEDMYCIIRTLEGEMVAPFGYYIVKGIKGEIYAVRPDIFHETYERVYATYHH